MSKHLDEKLIEAMERLERSDGHVVGQSEPTPLIWDAHGLSKLALDFVDSTDPAEVEFARERLLEAAALLCEAAGEKFERRKLGPVMSFVMV